MRIPLLALLLAATMASAAWAQDFEFVVIGDTRPKVVSKNFSHFEGLIPKINSVKPAFVVNLGDLIFGYMMLNTARQWDKYQKVIKAFRVPYYQIPGNHDTFSEEAREIYGRRFGSFYSAFDYGGCHFVLLDNTEEGRWGYLGAAELEWLKADLQATRARSVFVFLHFPVWESERIAPAYYDFWENTLHPLFKASRVRAVFGGHYHCYGPTREIDGISYYITGGGGAELTPAYRKSGGDFHFLRIRVSNDRIEPRVVTSQGELTDAEADVMSGLQFAERSSSRIGIGGDPAALVSGVKLSCSLENPFHDALSGRAAWDFDRTAFDVQPDSIAIDVAPKGADTFEFTLKALQAPLSPEPLPQLEFRLVSEKRHYVFQREILFLNRLTAPFRSRPPLLDGKLEDWAGVPLLQLSAAGGPSVPKASVRAFHDGEDFYLAVTVPTPTRVEAADPYFRDDLQVGMNERINDTAFGPDRVRLGFTRAGLAVEAKDRTPGHKAGEVLPGVRGVCLEDKGQTIYEIAFPVALLNRVKAEEAGRFVLNLSYFVPEGESRGLAAAEPRPNSFSYQVRYGGGNALSPVHFVELFLEQAAQ
jgi:hypothetical protein